MTTYYAANNQMRQPLVGSVPSYPILSINPSPPSVPSNGMMSSPSLMEPAQSTINVVNPYEPAPTLAARMKGRLSSLKTWCTWYNALKTVLVLGAVSVAAVYTINVVKSTMAPSVDVASITPICSGVNSCKYGGPLDFLVKVNIGGRDGDGETASSVAIYKPVQLFSTTTNTTSTTFQYLGQGKLVTAVDKTQPAPLFNASEINNKNDRSARPDDHGIALSGVVTLPNSPFTDSIVRTMIETGAFESTVVVVEVQTFIRQWFKDLQFIRNQQIAITL